MGFINELAIYSRNAEMYRESVFFATGTNNTGIASLDAPTSFDDALAAGSSNRSAILNIYNTALPTTAGGTKKVWVKPLMIRLTQTAINTGATSYALIGALDSKDRYVSGGTELTSESTSMDTRVGYSSRTNMARVNAGELVTSAEASSGSSAIVHNNRVSDVIGAVDDVIEIWFGQSGSVRSNDAVTSSVSLPDIWIGRGCSYTLYDFAPSQSADPAWIYEVYYLETGHPRQG